MAGCAPSAPAHRHRSRRRLAAVLLVLGVTATLSWLGVRAVAAAGGPAPVYSIAALEAHLASDPAPWLHRPLSVRAGLGGQCTAIGGLYTPFCSAWGLALTDPRFPDGQSADGSVHPLPLAWDRPSAWLTAMRRLPLVGRLVAPTQVLHSGVSAAYRIELRPTGCVLWQKIACDEALLLDALPPDNSTAWVRIGS